MQIDIHKLSYRETGSFSQLVTDYLDGAGSLRDMYAFEPGPEGIAAAIAARQAFPVDRQLLYRTLTEQYEGLVHTEASAASLELLKLDHTFTVCTAHQPNLGTGYLYFIYKIVHAVRLAEELRSRHPGRNFVPVFYMGSEDNDLDELGTFRYGARRFRWDGNGQAGAVGRMRTDGLEELFSELFALIGPPGPGRDELTELLRAAYMSGQTVAAATRQLVHSLFGRYGLLVLDPDEVGFKRAILPVLKDELLNQRAEGIVSRQTAVLSETYKVQARPREINLFYLMPGIRERIVSDGVSWQVQHTGISWTRSALLEELEAHPERFSPNVVLRGILQETILPDVAFIGGGAEVAYWLQLKSLFAHYGVFYPPVLLRQSALWIDPQAAALRKKLGCSVPDLFKDRESLLRIVLERSGCTGWKTEEERQTLKKLIAGLTEKAAALDPTLKGAAGAAAARMCRQLDAIERKMYRAVKRKEELQVQRVDRLHAALFPGGMLQERYDSFMPWYAVWGAAYIDVLCRETDPFNRSFLVIEENAAD